MILFTQKTRLFTIFLVSGVFIITACAQNKSQSIQKTEAVNTFLNRDIPQSDNPNTIEPPITQNTSTPDSLDDLEDALAEAYAQATQAENAATLAAAESFIADSISIIATQEAQKEVIAAQDYENKNAEIVHRCVNITNNLNNGDYSDIQPGVDLNGCDLNSIDLFGMDLSNSSFIGANLINTNLKNTNLKGADFTGAIIHNTNFDGASIDNYYLNKSIIVLKNIGVGGEINFFHDGALSHDGQILATSSSDGDVSEIQLWSTSTGEIIDSTQFESYGSLLEYIYFSPNDNMILGVGKNGYLFSVSPLEYLGYMSEGSVSSRKSSGIWHPDSSQIAIGDLHGNPYLSLIIGETINFTNERITDTNVLKRDWHAMYPAWDADGDSIYYFFSDLIKKYDLPDNTYDSQFESSNSKYNFYGKTIVWNSQADRFAAIDENSIYIFAIYEKQRLVYSNKLDVSGVSIADWDKTGENLIVIKENPYPSLLLYSDKNKSIIFDSLHHGIRNNLELEKVRKILWNDDTKIGLYLGGNVFLIPFNLVFPDFIID